MTAHLESRPHRGVRTAILVSLTAVVFAAAPPAATADDDAVTQFGQLPVRFNGRITTVQSAAAARLRQISGRNVYFDDAGRKHSAAEWFLFEASRGPPRPAPLVLKIENAELLKLLNLVPQRGGIKFWWTNQNR